MSEIEVESTEEWRPVVGCEGVYSVSSLGRVRRDAPGKGSYPGKILKSRLNRLNGYPYVCLPVNHRYINKLVHTIVAEAFIGPRPEGMDVAHNNGISTDNRVENLRYASRRENLLDGHRYGGRVTRQKLSLQDVSDIRYLLDAGYQAKDLAFAYKCAVSHIYRIKSGHAWSHRLDQTLIAPSDD